MPTLADSLNNLAKCYRECSNYIQAEFAHQEALEIVAKALPTEHELRGRFLDDFATLRGSTGTSTEEAKTLYQQALEILEPKLGC
jgi:tetratricopeptide (TPR) repeat protein